MGTVREEDGRVFVAPGPMQALLLLIFRGAGCEEPEAASIAMRLVGANLRGHDSHGVIRTPRYLQWIDSGRQIPNQRVTVIEETDTLAILDGHYGFGQVLGEQTVDIGINKAKRSGVAVTALRNSGHLGRVGDWGERAAASNIASIHFVNVRGSLLVAPFGGVERRGGTSPFCCAVPLPGEDPIVLDFATALAAEGKALVAVKGGKPLPEGALVTADGTLTNDPLPLYGEIPEDGYPDATRGTGALTAFGLHKGSGLNFFMEMFAGALAGSGTAGAVGEDQRRRFCNGMLSIYLAVEAFHRDDWFANEVRSYIEFVKSSKPIVAGGEVLVPGEMERRTMAERHTTGLPLSPQTWSDLLACPAKVGVSQAAVDEVLRAGD